MDDAVSVAIDKNPTGALRILLPVYGAQTVCAEEEAVLLLTEDMRSGGLDSLTGLLSHQNGKRASRSSGRFCSPEKWNDNEHFIAAQLAAPRPQTMKCDFHLSLLPTAYCLLLYPGPLG